MLFEVVARSTGLFRDYGAVAAEKCVHQAGFASVHLPGEHHESAFAPASGTFVAGKKCAYAFSHFLCYGSKFLRGQTFTFFIGEVDGEADALAQIFEALAEFGDLSTEKAVQLGRGEIDTFA